MATLRKPQRPIAAPVGLYASEVASDPKLLNNGLFDHNMWNLAIVIRNLGYNQDIYINGYHNFEFDVLDRMDKAGLTSPTNDIWGDYRSLILGSGGVLNLVEQAFGGGKFDNLAFPADINPFDNHAMTTTDSERELAIATFYSDTESRLAVEQGWTTEQLGSVEGALQKALDAHASEL